MNADKQKARFGAGTPKRAVGWTDFSGSSLTPIPDSTMCSPDRQMVIADLLGSGQENAVPLQHLMTLTGLDSRTIRQRIERERRAGVPICSDNKTGYFLPTNELERDRCVQSMRHRAEEIRVTAEAIAAGKLEG